MIKASKDFSDKYRILIQNFGEVRIKLGESLADYTYLKSRAAAECLFIATTRAEFIRVLGICSELELPYFIIGGGTKSLLPDKGVKGLVIKNRTSQIRLVGIKGKVGVQGIGIEEASIEVDSGVSIGKLNQFLKEQGLQVLYGISIPQSTVGGAIFLDPALREKTEKISIWDRGEVYDITLNELKKMRHIVLSVVIKMKSIR